MNQSYIMLFLLMILSGCKLNELIGSSTINIKNRQHLPPPSVTGLQLSHDQILVTGKNLQYVETARLQGPTEHSFAIESKTPSQIILKATSILSLMAQGSVDLLLSHAHASASFPISIELQNGQVTAIKLSSMGATSGQFLRYNGSSWAPANMNSSLHYIGTYDASTDTPDIVALGGILGNFYIVTTGGTQDLGNGSQSFTSGDWVIFDGSSWNLIPMSGNSVSSFNGRRGIVTPLSGDYSWSMLTKASGKVTGSRLAEIADVDITGRQDGHVLKWDQASSTWISRAESVPSGSITSTELASSSVDSSKINDGSIVNADVSATANIAQSKIQNLTTDLAAKEPAISASTSAQYFRGDKTWATLNTSVVPEGSNLYFLESRVRGSLLDGYAIGSALPLDPADTLLQALAKLEGQIAANPGYWTKTSSNISYNSGNIGIGTSTPSKKVSIDSSTIGDGIVIRNGTNNIAELSGNGLANDSGTLRLSDSGSVKVFLRSAGSGYIDNGGYAFGIGTNSPTSGSGLDVRNNSTTGTLQIFNTSASGFSGAQFWNNSGAGKASIGWYNASASSFASSFALGTALADPIIFYTNGSNRIQITSSGAVGIGVAAPGAKLDVTDTGTTTSAIIVPRAANFTGATVNGMIRYNTSSSLFEFRQNGAWVNFTTASDKRLKTNVKPVQNGLQMVNKLNPVYFDWDQKQSRAKSFGTQHQVGFLAQEVEGVVPEVVNKGEDGYYTLEYGKLVSVIVAAVKEIYSMVSGMDRRMASLELENKKLKEDHAAMKSYLCQKDPSIDMCKGLGISETKRK